MYFDMQKKNRDSFCQNFRITNSIHHQCHRMDPNFFFFLKFFTRSIWDFGLIPTQIHPATSDIWRTHIIIVTSDFGGIRVIIFSLLLLPLTNPEQLPSLPHTDSVDSPSSPDPLLECDFQVLQVTFNLRQHAPNHHDGAQIVSFTWFLLFQ